MTAPLRPPTAITQATSPQPLILKAHTTPESITEIGATSFVLIGPSGSGKTEFACGLPEPFFVQFDTNLKTLEKHPSIPYILPKDWMDQAPGETSTTKVFSERVLPLLEARRAHEMAGRPVQSIVFDTGTAMCEDLLLWIVGEKTNQTDSQAKFGQLLREGHKLFKRIAYLAMPRGDLPRYNVAVLFHLGDKRDKQGNFMHFCLSVTGAMQTQLQRHFDTVLLLRCRAETAVQANSGKTDTTYHFEACSIPPDRDYPGLAFDRLGGISVATGKRGPWNALPPIISDPSYAKLVELWTAKS